MLARAGVLCVCFATRASLLAAQYAICVSHRRNDAMASLAAWPLSTVLPMRFWPTSLRFGACPMPDDLSTSTAVERERVRVVRSQLYLYTRRRELYTPGAAEPRDAASRDREVVR